jgi:hypothetical protein
MDDGVQTASDGIVVDEVPGDDGKYVPTMETTQTTRLVTMSRLVRIEGIMP